MHKFVGVLDNYVKTINLHSHKTTHCNPFFRRTNNETQTNANHLLTFFRAGAIIVTGRGGTAFLSLALTQEMMVKTT